MSTLLERLLPRIDTVSNSIRSGGFSGMCSVAYPAHKAGEITTAEYDALLETIDAYTTEHHVGYVVFHLAPEFDDMTDNPRRFTFPNDVSERAAQLWKEWAVNLVTQVQETLCSPSRARRSLRPSLTKSRNGGTKYQVKEPK